MKLGLRNLRAFYGEWEKQFDAARRVGADYLQVDGVPQEEVATVADLVESTGVGIWSVTALSTAMLGPDAEAAEREQANVRAAVERAAQLGAACVTVFAGNDPARTFERNMETFAEVFGPLAEHAQAHGVTLVLENCPMFGGRPPAPRNLAYCPAHWEAMFEAVPSDGLGLELDFGHLPGLGIDPVRAVRDFGGKIRHVGMKDAAVDPQKVYRFGWISPAVKSYRPPGEGEVPFGKVIAALAEVGYEGPLTMEHISPELDTVERYERTAGYLRGLLPT